MLQLYTQLTLCVHVQQSISKCIVGESLRSFELFLDNLGYKKFQKKPYFYLKRGLLPLDTLSSYGEIVIVPHTS